MSQRTRSLLLCLTAGLLLAPAAPADAYWLGAGAGAGSGPTATMPAGNQPSASVAGLAVTVTWPQSSFLGSSLGTYAGGGYTLRRYASGGSTPITPNASCATTISGAGATLQCVEAGVPYGAWQYAVTPVLNTFTGAASTKSPAISVVTAAPTLASATAGNPTAGQTTGDIDLAWGTVTGAVGYNVYRRVSGGSFDYGAPRNGATPVTATTYSDAGAGLAAATTYDYVVRAVAGSPVVESASSGLQSAATISRPAAPASVTATAAPAARVDVGWGSVAGAAGYNVYRTSTGVYDYASPLNGGTLVATLTYADLTAVNAVTYRYVVRSVILGAGGARVESASSVESGAVIADSVAPAVPTAASVTSGGPLWAGGCSVSANTQYVNTAGAAASGVSATIAAPEVGQTVVFSATTPGSTPVTGTVAAGSTTVTGILDLSTLLDGTITLTARTKDLAGNLSAPFTATNIIKDTIVPALSAGYSNPLGLNPRVSGTSECGATIVAVRVGRPSDVYQDITAPNGTFSFSVSGSLLGLGSVSYNVTSTDRAGNVSPVVVAT